MKTLYANIVFIQGSEALEPIDMDNIQDKVDYLAMWDYGEYHDISENRPFGNSDNIERVKIENGLTYIVSENQNIPYISLTLEIKENHKLFNELI